MQHHILVKNLAADSLKSPLIINAFKNVKREDFVLESDIQHAYLNKDLRIKSGQLITKPSVVAFMLELLQPQIGNKVLDVGAGSGYTTALLAKIVGNGGYVYGVEILPELRDFGTKNLRKYSLHNSVIYPAQVELGLVKHAPFDRILVSFFVSSIPNTLLGQLKVGGVMVIPVKNDIVRVTKVDDNKFDEDIFEGYPFQKALGNYQV